MRHLRFALVAAAVAGLTLAALDAPAFARGNGTAGGPGAGSGPGGAAGGGGSNPLTAANTLPPHHPNPYGLPIPARSFSASCQKQEPMFDRYGNVVAHMHGVDCAE